MVFIYKILMFVLNVNIVICFKFLTWVVLFEQPPVLNIYMKVSGYGLDILMGFGFDGNEVLLSTTTVVDAHGPDLRGSVMGQVHVGTRFGST